MTISSGSCKIPGAKAGVKADFSVWCAAVEKNEIN